MSVKTRAFRLGELEHISYALDKIASPYGIGSQVTLNSGSPTMTVLDIADGMVVCGWGLEGGVFANTHTFHPACVNPGSHLPSTVLSEC